MNTAHAKLEASWLSAKAAARLVSVSTDTIERRGIAWCSDAVPRRLRFKFLLLDGDARPVRRYYAPDVEALLLTPVELPSQSRQRLTPRFINRQTEPQELS